MGTVFQNAVENETKGVQQAIIDRAGLRSRYGLVGQGWCVDKDGKRIDVNVDWNNESGYIYESAAIDADGSAALCEAACSESEGCKGYVTEKDGDHHKCGLLSPQSGVHKDYPNLSHQGKFPIERVDGQRRNFCWAKKGEKDVQLGRHLRAWQGASSSLQRIKEEKRQRQAEAKDLRSQYRRVGQGWCVDKKGRRIALNVDWNKRGYIYESATIDAEGGAALCELECSKNADCKGYVTEKDGDYHKCGLLSPRSGVCLSHQGKLPIARVDEQKGNFCWAKKE